MVSIDSWWNGLVRDRAEAVLELVINACADDYESLEIILDDINRWPEFPNPVPWPAMSAVPVSRPEVIEALRVLTLEGYVQAYILDTNEPYAQAVEFHVGSVDYLWFYVTPKGKQSVKQI